MYYLSTYNYNHFYEAAKLKEDPIWSTNLYPYADNNPIVYIDPEGTLFGGVIYHPLWSCKKMARKETKWEEKGKEGKLKNMHKSWHYSRCTNPNNSGVYIDYEENMKNLNEAVFGTNN